MTDAIGYPQLLERITFVLKLALHANKGGNQEELLEKAIVVYNVFKEIESNMTDLPKEKMDRVSKLLLRFNLSFKVKPDGTLANPSQREDCRMISTLSPHQILYSEDYRAAREFADEHDIKPITGIPLSFLLKEGRFQELSWLYIQSIFFISQYISAKKPTYPDGARILEDALDQLDNVLTRAELIKEEIKIDERLSRDSYLRRKLFKPDIISAGKIEEAKAEMFRIFKKKGTENSLIFKLIDRVGDRVTDIQNSEGSLFTGMFGVAKDIAIDMKEELQANQDSMASSVRAAKSVFNEAFQKSVADGENITPELQGIVNTIDKYDPNNPTIDISQLRTVIDATSSVHGLTSDQVEGMMQGSSGDPVQTMGDTLEKTGLC